MTALIRHGSYMVEVHVNWGRWVASCGLCPWAARLQQFQQPHIECPLCGTVTEILWPTEAMARGVERLLMMRPSPANRNWTPGESLHDLMFENGAHGIFDGLPDDEPVGHIGFKVLEDRVLVDNLPALATDVRKALT